MKILHKLDNEDLPTLFELLGKDDKTAIDVLVETMIKNPEPEFLSEYLEKIKEFDVNIEINEGDLEDENKEWDRKSVV